MAVDDAYADAPTYRNRINGSTSSANDAAILVGLKAISRALEARLGRFFTKDGAVTTRQYYPDGYYRGDPEAENPWRYVRGSNELEVIDIADTTGLIVKVDDDRDGIAEVTLAANDYQLYPLNANKGSEARPWEKLLIPRWSTRGGWAPGGIVEVTALHGWPAIPPAISEFVIQIAAMLRLETPRASTRLDEDIADALDGATEEHDVVLKLTRGYGRHWVMA